MHRGAWVAQSVEPRTSAQIMISRSVSSSPAPGSVLTAQSLERASDSVSLSLCPSPACTPSPSLTKNKQTLKKLRKKKKNSLKEKILIKQLKQGHS